MKVGLISDTHGSVHPGAFRVFDGVDLILHAGDAESAQDLSDLEALAPVLAVRGNMDAAPLLAGLPLLRIMEIEGHRVALIHNVSLLDRELRKMDKTASELEVVVFGHTHRPERRLRGRTLYVNPGAAEWRSGRTSCTVAILNLARGRAPEVEHVELVGTGARNE